MVVTQDGKLPRNTATTDAFGEFLYELMGRKDIRNPSELSKALAGTECPSSRQTVANYMTGETPVSPTFVATVARLLNLGKRDKTKLAYMACYRDEF